MSNPRGVEISVVVPAYFGARTIVSCVESLERATRGRRREIIVVDSSGDGTADLVRRRFPEVAVIASTKRLSVGAARNLGLEHASGAFVYFTDQDCVVPSDWIQRLEAYFSDPRVGAVGGSLGVRNPSCMSGFAVYVLEFLNHFPIRQAPSWNRNFLLGCNGGYRAEVFDAVRFPDQTLGEDVLFSDAVRRAGFDVVYDSTVTVLHQNREGWGEFFRYNRKMGAAAAEYHRRIGGRLSKVALRFPWLAFGAPGWIIPLVASRLFRTRWSYLWRFLLLSPLCTAGNLVWASAFVSSARRPASAPFPQELPATTAGRDAA